MVSDATGHAAGRRRRRHPGRAPHPRPRGRALLHDDRGAAAVRRAPRLPRRRQPARARRRALRPLVLLRAARPPVRRRPRRRLAPHRLRRRRRRGGPSGARDEANEGVRPWTKIFDHYFFDSCYSMSPGGRMEICTTGPGFQLDEKLEDLGDRLCLSPRVEPLRAKLESELTPIVNPRPRSKAKAAARRPRPTACRDGACDRRLTSPSPSTTARTRRRRPGSWTCCAERGLKATFFVVGRAAARAPRARRARARRGALDRQPHAHPPAPAGRAGRGRAACEIEAAQARARRARPARPAVPARPARAATSSPGCSTQRRRRHAGRGRLHVRALERGPGRLEGPAGWVEPRAARRSPSSDWTLLVLHDVAGAPPTGSRSSSTAPTVTFRQDFPPDCVPIRDGQIDRPPARAARGLKPRSGGWPPVNWSGNSLRRCGQP